MTKLLEPKPYPAFLKLLDICLRPCMYLIAGTFSEAPQETHGWNVRNLTRDEQDHINYAIDAPVAGTYKGFLGKSHGWILFHFPVLGGWKDYAVLEVLGKPEDAVWHIGWFGENEDGSKYDVAVSRIPLTDPQVRMLKAPVGVSTKFFAIDTEGTQLELRIIAEGCIGDGGEYKKVRLL